MWFGAGLPETAARYGMREYARWAICNWPQLQGRSKGFLTWFEEQVALMDGEITREFYRAALKIDCRPLLKDIKVPTLLINGSEGGCASVADQQYILAQIPNAREVLFQRHILGVHYIQPDRCAREVLRFLADLGIILSAALRETGT